MITNNMQLWAAGKPLRIAGRALAGLIPLAVLVSVSAGSGGGNPRVIFQRQAVSTTANGAVSVFAADLDGDGDMDLLSASAVDDKIAWYESLGGKHPAFVEHTISNRAREATSVSATDVDGDGDMDVLSASCVDDKIAWYENLGGNPPIFVERVLTEDPDGVVGDLQGMADCAQSVLARDLDGDGDMDILFVASSAEIVGWFENDGGKPPNFTPHVIARRSSLLSSPVSVASADLDGDGDMDVLSAGSHVITWHENRGGSPPSFVSHRITNQVYVATSVIAADVDSDGDVDVLSSSFLDDKIAWYENIGGTPSRFVEHVVVADPDGLPGPLRGFADGATSVFAADLDGDGDTDLLSTSSNDDKVAWYENKGGSPPLFIPREISVRSHGNRPTLPGAIRGAKQVFATDLNGDGDVDVAAASFDEDTIEWFANRAILPEK